jgi:hypothetical protein
MQALAQESDEGIPAGEGIKRRCNRVEASAHIEALSDPVHVTLAVSGYDEVSDPGLS